VCGLASNTLGQESRYDDISVKPMPISSLMAVAAVNASPDVFASADLVVTAGTQAGILLNSDSSFHAKLVANYAAGETALTLTEVTKAITTGDTITIRATADTSYAITSVGALSGTTQSIVLTSGLVADITASALAPVEIGVDVALANYVIAYHDGTNAHLDSVVNGAATALINAAATYAAGASLKVWKLGTAYRLYWNSALVGTQQTIASMDGLYHGLFSTYASNTADSFVVYPTTASIPGVE
jgi:hypothetical protein